MTRVRRGLIAPAASITSQGVQRTFLALLNIDRDDWRPSARCPNRIYMIQTTPYSVRRSDSSLDLGGSSSDACVAKDELVDCTPTSVVGGGLEADAVVEMLDSDEFAELIRLSRASRSTQSTERNLSRCMDLREVFLDLE
jgi:hypothetical protein